MTPQEKADAARLSKVMRAARKLFGLNQRTVADFLGISQAALSKMEAGARIPSASQWLQLCRKFGINSEFSYDTGLIDNCLPVSQGGSYPQEHFRVPKKYLQFQGSKVRTMQPFLHFFSDKLGEKALNEYFRGLKIDPDFFTVYDNQLNARFNLDLIETLIDKGVLKKADVPKIARPLTSPQIHGRFHEEYRHQESSRSLILRFIANIPRYESNFSYSVVDDRKGEIAISIRPLPTVRHFQYKSPRLGSFLCDYKKEYLKRFSTYLGGSQASITESECHFHGAGQCLYQIHL